jgi:cell division protein FtsW
MTERRPVDRWLMGTVIFLVLLGVMMVYSASYAVGYTQFHDSAYFFKRQLAWLVVGLGGAWLASRLDYDKLRAAAPWLFAAALLALIAVLVPGVGTMEGGARRWLEYGPFSFEPSELAKIALVVLLAKMFAQRDDGARSFRKAGVPALLAVGLCFYLVMKEPDLGTASLLLLTAFVMMCVAGARARDLALEALIALPGLVLFIYSSAYRRDRFLAFLDPWKDPQGTGYHIIQSLYALGSGGIFGVGLGESRQKFGYLPEANTDFIYSIIGEELGFIGAAIVLVAFLLLAQRGITIAMKANDRFGSYLAAGITASIVLQAFVNIGVATSTFPVTGVPLPFISYGGTSLVVSLLGAGILASISRGRPQRALSIEARNRGSNREDPIGRRRHGRSSVPRAVVSQSALRRAR